MPFTQDRAIALITAGNNYKQAYDKLYKLTRLLDQELTHQSDFEKYRIAVISFLITASEPLPTAVQDSVTLLTEHDHFRRFKRDNARRAAKQRKRRNPTQPLLEQLTPELPPIAPAITANIPIDDDSYIAFRRGQLGDPGAEHVKPKIPMFDRDPKSDT